MPYIRYCMHNTSSLSFELYNTLTNSDFVTSNCFQHKNTAVKKYPTELTFVSFFHDFFSQTSKSNFDDIKTSITICNCLHSTMWFQRNTIKKMIISKSQGDYYQMINMRETLHINRMTYFLNILLTSHALQKQLLHFSLLKHLLSMYLISFFGYCQ